MHHSPQKCANVVVTCAILHNFGLNVGDNFGYFETEEQDIPELPPFNFKTTGNAFWQSLIRNHFT